MNKFFKLIATAVLMCLAMLATGCATFTPEKVYVNSVRNVPVKVSGELLRITDVPAPPSKKEFMPFTPVNDRDRLELLYIQRDLLIRYSQSLIAQVGIYKEQIDAIRKEQERSAEIILKE